MAARKGKAALLETKTRKKKKRKKKKKKKKSRVGGTWEGREPPGEEIPFSVTKSEIVREEEKFCASIGRETKEASSRDATVGLAKWRKRKANRSPQRKREGEEWGGQTKEKIKF